MSDDKEQIARLLQDAHDAVQDVLDSFRDGLSLSCLDAVTRAREEIEYVRREMGIITSKAKTP